MRLSLLLIFTLLIYACASVAPRHIVKIDSIDDIPDINVMYEYEIARLETGMTKDQVNSLFSNMEQECFPSGTCYMTVFDKRFVQIDRRIGDLNLLTGSLVSLLALTCIIAEEECAEAIIAAFNVGIASALGANRIQTSQGKDGVFTLLQWINIELENGQVKQWAINEQLPQFQPKTFKNELPPLEESLKTTN